MGTPSSQNNNMVSRVEAILGEPALSDMRELSDPELLRIVEVVLAESKPFLRSLGFSSFKQVIDDLRKTGLDHLDRLELPAGFYLGTRCTVLLHLYSANHGLHQDVILTEDAQLLLWESRFPAGPYGARRGSADYSRVQWAVEPHGILEPAFRLNQFSVHTGFMHAMHLLVSKALEKREEQMRNLSTLKERLAGIQLRATGYRL